MRGRLLVVLLLAAMAAGCATKKKMLPAEQLWAQGTQAFKDEAWELSVERYKTLLDQHPFDPNAEEAELRIAQAHYYAGRYAEAIAAFGDFERMHPTSSNLALIEYHLGMAYLSQSSTSDRDQQAEKNAHTYFRNLVDRFPESPWSEKARLRLRECREKMASHEAGIAEYYLRHGNLKAAESRLRGLLTEYPDSEGTARALYTFAQTYAQRKETEGATLALATLARHHADGPLGADARKRLDGAGLDGQDPLPLLVRHLDQMEAQADRQKLPRSVSAYGDAPPGASTRY